ncbi:hypothetical protein HRI_003560200 [Hibiscus trionum]|uniref:Uncharacterized protein n=1 Tax=Hibiscus trionum TaxID=183268 RepID=A0A9W7ILR1_HIBTR|nr:hypothetical protein HRI_003560200 [Hibiscus trionum]
MEAKTKETPSVDNNNHDDEEDEEINAFFTLVRNIRDVRNQMLIVSQATKEKQESAAAAMEKSTWTPSFQWEDFVEDRRHLTNNTTTVANATLPSSSKNNDEQKSKTHEHQDLDLNLSL